MIGKENQYKTMIRKFIFMCLPTSVQRSRYIYKHKHLFHEVGEKLFFQSRLFPSDPQLISIGNNVNIAAGVVFINHDIMHALINKMNNGCIKMWGGCIKIGNNVMIGAKCIILPNVEIGDNVVIGAGSIVTKDIPSNMVAAGSPAKVIGKTSDLIEKCKRRKNSYFDDPDMLWDSFKKDRMNK